MRKTLSRAFGVSLIFAGAMALTGVPRPAEAQVPPTLACTDSPRLLNTGFDGVNFGDGEARLPTGSDDLNWEFFANALPGPTSTPSILNPLPDASQYSPAIVVDRNSGGWSWTDSPFFESQWVSFNVDRTHQDGFRLTDYVDFYYRYDLELSAADAARFSPEMEFYVDNAVVEVFVNGVPQSGNNANFPGYYGADPYQYNDALNVGPTELVNLQSSWQAGVNEIVFVVTSFEPQSGLLVRTNSLCTDADVADAPGTFGPASQRIASGGQTLAIGSSNPDADTVDLASVDAEGDDAVGDDEELTAPDAETFDATYAVTALPVINTTGEDAFLCGFIDAGATGGFNDVFDAASEVACYDANTDGTPDPIPAGSSSVDLTWTNLAFLSGETETFLRLRLSANLAEAQTPSSVGAFVGEVEDHLVAITTPAAVLPILSCSSLPSAFNSGFDNDNNQVITGSPPPQDPDWQVASLAGGGHNLSSPIPPYGPTFLGAEAPPWISDPFSGESDWISNSASSMHSDFRTFFFRYDFTLENPSDVAAFAPELTFYVDNSIAEIYVNGQAQSGNLAAIPNGATGNSFGDQSNLQAGGQDTVVLERNWQLGPNELVIQVSSGPDFVGLNIGGTGASLCALDFADTPADGDTAPDGSGTTSYGIASHFIDGDFFMGVIPPDRDFGPNAASADALGDDTTPAGAPNDDDGVTFPTLEAGSPATITVDVNETNPGSEGFLQAWFDFDGNGVFDLPADQIASNVQDGGAGDDDGAANGVIELPIAVPSTAITSAGTFARFRWSSIADLNPIARAPNGEVEDFQAFVQLANAPVGTPFACPAIGPQPFYQLYEVSPTGIPDRSQLAIIDIEAGTTNNIGSPSPAGVPVNAAGLGPDNLVYGINQFTKTLVRVDANGDIIDLGPVTGLDTVSDYTSGDFGPNGNLFVRPNAGGGNEFVEIDVDGVTNTGVPEVVNTYNAGPGFLAQDIVFNPSDGRFYGVESLDNDALLVAIDVLGGTSETYSTGLDTTNNRSIGSLYADNAGNIFGIQQVPPGATNPPIVYQFFTDGRPATAVGVGRPGFGQDGFNCKTGRMAVPTDFGDSPGTFGDVSQFIGSGTDQLYIGGTAPDSETASLASANALLDDTTGAPPDDEDFDAPGATAFDTTYSVSVPVVNTTGQNATLCGFLDTGGTADAFDAGEEVCVAANASGTFALDWTGISVPNETETFLRLRLSADATEAAIPASLGNSIGEIEDARVAITPSAPGTPPVLSCTSDPRIFNTGFNGTSGFLPDAAPDLNWQVFNGPANATPFPTAGDYGLAFVAIETTVVPPGTGRQFWADVSTFTPPQPDAQWISHQPDTVHTGDQDYFYRIDFEIADQETLDRFAPELFFFADNSVWEVFVNGAPQSPGLAAVPSSLPGYNDPGSFAGTPQGNQSVTLTNNWQLGLNELVVQLRSEAPFAGMVTATASDSLCADADFGDVPADTATAPDGSSQTAYGSPAHLIDNGGFFMGATPPDAEEPADTASPDATGDNTNGTADEDGYTFQRLQTGLTGYFDVTVNQPTAFSGYLHAWIDWNGDGDFDDIVDGVSEQIANGIQDDLAPDITDPNIVPGRILFATPVPASAITTADTFVRFRWSSSPTLDSTSVASDGEVEDYAVRITNPAPPNPPPALSCTTPPTLFNTALDNGAGTLYPVTTDDFDWQVAVGRSSATGGNPTVALPPLADYQNAISVGQAVNLWITSPFTDPGAPADWIARSPNARHGDLGDDVFVDYFYRFDFNLDPNDADAFRPVFNFFVDNSVWEIYVNGVPQSAGLAQVPTASVGTRYNDATSYSGRRITVLDQNWQPGPNELIFQVSSQGTHEGFLLSATSLCADYGDVPADGETAPDTTSTTSYGEASHAIDGDLLLGTVAPDADDPTATASLNALGDDLEGVADEEGVTIPTLVAGTATVVDVTVGQGATPGFLQAWVDFNGDGAFDDTTERVATDLTDPGTGIIQVTIDPPIDAINNPTFARFRWSSESALGSTGAAPDGEVEDYQVTINSALDFGDAQGNPTDGTGASHAIDPAGPHLGALAPDAETAGFSTANADGDDTTGTDDEDGFTEISDTFANSLYSFDIEVNDPDPSNPVGFLSVFVDTAQDASFASTLVTGVQDDGTGTDLVAGDGIINVSGSAFPGTAINTQYSVRLRYCTVATECDEPLESASDGEIEDHFVITQEGDPGDFGGFCPYEQDFDGLAPIYSSNAYYALNNTAQRNGNHVTNSGASVGGPVNNITADASGTGLFLFHNTQSGNPVGDMWGTPSSVTVTPDTTYVFSFQLASNNNTAPAQIEPFINGVSIGAPVVVNSPLGDWVQYDFIWNSGTATTADLTLRNNQAGFTGNDFGLDEVTLCPAIDFGDAQGNPTDGTGASHAIDPTGPHLGAVAPDAEPAGFSTANADGDDNDATPNDEDGFFEDAPTIANGPYSFDITVNENTPGTAFLSVFVDTDLNGTFASTLVTGVRDDGTGDDLVAGDGVINVNGSDFPGTALSTAYPVRLRLCSTASECDAPLEAGATDGEIEDHIVTTFSEPLAPIFACTPGDPVEFYQTYGDDGQTALVDLVNGAFVNLPANAGVPLNATGFRTSDRVAYSIEIGTNVLYAIRADGSGLRLGPIAGLPTSAGNYNSGDVGPNGNLFVKPAGSNDELYEIDIDARSVVGTVIDIGPDFTTSDIAWDAVTSRFFAVSTANDRLVAFDLTGGFEDIGPTDLPAGGGSTFGAMYADSLGQIFGIRNSDGRLFQFQTAPGTGTAVRAGQAAADSRNDGFGCTLGPANLPTDFGDAPISGQTAPGGIITPDYGFVSQRVETGALFMGSVGPDIETNNQPTPIADGDDLIGDDEDVVIPAASGGQASYAVTVPVFNDTGADAYLCGFLDAGDTATGLGFDGTFDAPAATNALVNAQERACVQVPTGGAQTVTLTWDTANNNAPDFVAGQPETYLRLRLSTVIEEAQTPNGAGISIGEAEDHYIRLGQTDFGDAQGNPTDGTGASHTIDPTGPHLGNIAPDAEPAGFSTANADGDDTTGTNDEDGFTETASTFPGSLYSFDVSLTETTSGTAFLSVFVDSGLDGTFASTLATGLLDDGTTGDDRVAGDGVININGSDFPGLTPNTAYPVRLRLCSTLAECDEPLEAGATDGEIEDHIVTTEPDVLTPTFACTTATGAVDFYQAYRVPPANSTIAQVDLVNGAFQDIGNAGIVITALGYRESDEIAYGLLQDSNILYALRGDGTAVRLGPVAGLPAGLRYPSGDIGPNGNLFVMPTGDNDDIYEIDIDRRVVVGGVGSTGSIFRTADIVWDPVSQFFYAVTREAGAGGRLVRFEVNGTFQSLGRVGFGTLNDPFQVGAMYADSDGNIYGIRNSSGILYQFNTTNGSSTIAGQAANATSNDGFNCKSNVANIPTDYGDAPVGEPSPLNSINGAYDFAAQRRDPAALYLGAGVPDAEAVNQPTANADGDDLNGDDEDVVIPVPSVGQLIYTVNVPVFNNSGDVAYLCGFLDAGTGTGFSGTFEAPAATNALVNAQERACISVPSTGAQTVPLTWSAANNNAPVFGAGQTETYIRLRLSTVIEEAQTPNGLGASIGEVEDHYISLAQLDFGDAPGTPIDGTGASHAVDPAGPYLGAVVPDAEPAGFDTPLADGDDSTAGGGIDDEDLDTATAPPVGGAVTIDWDVSGPDADNTGRAFVNGAVVANGPYSFDIVVTEPAGTAGTAALYAWVDTTGGAGPTWASLNPGGGATALRDDGTNGDVVAGDGVINVNGAQFPGTLTSTDYPVRFRFCTNDAECSDPVLGGATNGEVEDHIVTTSAVPLTTPFACTAGGAGQLFQMFIPGDIAEIDLASGTVDVFGPTGLEFNAAGLNETSNLVYGLGAVAPSLGHLLVSDANNGPPSGIDLGPVAGLPAVAYFAGDIGPNDLLYVVPAVGGNVVYAIDVNARAVVATFNLNATASAGDIAYSPSESSATNSVFYFSTQTQLFRIVLDESTQTSGTVTAVGGTTGLTSGGTFGSMFAEGSGNVYGTQNDGRLFQFDTTDGSATQVGSVDQTGLDPRDGFNCKAADLLIPTDFGDAPITGNSPAEDAAAGTGIPGVNYGEASQRRDPGDLFIDVVGGTGEAPDAEVDGAGLPAGQSNATADGDDTNIGNTFPGIAARDDEESSPTNPAVGQTDYSVTVDVNNDTPVDAYLCGFLDAGATGGFNGEFDAPAPGAPAPTDGGERACLTIPAGSGINQYTLEWNATNGNAPLFALGESETYLRLRLSTVVEEAQTPASPGVSIGEVEDYRLTLNQLDYGDAPTSGNPFGAGDTLTAAYPEASAAASSLIFLGPVPPVGVNPVDVEPAYQPDDRALGDDNSGRDDEDGIEGVNPVGPGDDAFIDADALQLVVLNDPRTQANQFSVNVQVNNLSTGDAFLGAFIDFNRDGDFDDQGETGVPVPANIASGSQGSFPVRFDVPASTGIDFGGSFLRVIVSDQPVTSADGNGGLGEVEDHLVVLGQSFLCAPSTNFAGLDFSNLAGISGTGGAGTRADYTNVGFTNSGEPVDARLEVINIIDGTVPPPLNLGIGNGNIDGQYNEDEAAIIIGANPGNTARATVQLSFFFAGTTTPADMNVVLGTGDLDLRSGTADARQESVELDSTVVVGYGVNNPTTLTVNEASGTIRFAGTVDQANQATSFAIYGFNTASFFNVTLVNEAFTTATSTPARAGYAFDGSLAQFNVPDLNCDPLDNADFGDAPDSYGTTAGADGPQHLVFNGDDPTDLVTPQIRIGTNETDADDGNATGAAADTDDSTDRNDEDAEVPDTLPRGSTVTFDITTFGSGFLSVWIDADNSGEFDLGTADDVLIDEPIVTGTETITVTLPATTTLGDNYMRLRVCSAAGVCNDPHGPAPDGEVEDHLIQIVDPLDYGDAPVGGTDVGGVLRDYGEAAQIVGNLRLGAAVDLDLANQPSADAQGDDTDTGLNSGDDEDGVRFNNADLQAQRVPIGTDSVLQVSASGPGFLSAWLDWNQNGVFDAGERFADDIAVNNGQNLVNLPVPDVAGGTVLGDTFMRFRLCSVADTCDAPTGAVLTPGVEGEVEDYLVTLAEPAIRIEGRVFEDNAAAAGADTAHDGEFNAVGGTEVGLGGVIVEAIATPGSGIVVASTTTNGDGTYSLVLPDGFTGAVEVRVATAGPEWLHISDFSVANAPLEANPDPVLPGLVNASTLDGVLIFTPVEGGVYEGVDFGQIRQPLLQLDNIVSTVPGGVVVVPHAYTATTTGDVFLGVVETAETPNADAFGPVEIFIDANGNGQPDAGELLTGPIEVTEGEVLPILLRTQAAPTVPLGATLTLDIVAFTDFTGNSEDTDSLDPDVDPYIVVGNAASCTAIEATLPAGFDADHCITNTDQINAAEPVALEITKEVCNATANGTFGLSNVGEPGDVLVYRLTVTNTSSQPATNVDVFDATPAFTTAFGTTVASDPDVADPLAPAVGTCGPAQSSVPAAVTACTVSAPAAGNGGTVAWDCDGQYNPGDQAVFYFQVQIDQ